MTISFHFQGEEGVGLGAAQLYVFLELRRSPQTGVSNSRMWQFRLFLLLTSTWGISSIPAHPGKTVSARPLERPLGFPRHRHQ